MILDDPTLTIVTIAVTLESLNLTTSLGSNTALFKYTNPTPISLFLVKYTPTAPLDWPTNLSPIIKSLVFELGPSIDPIFKLGDSASFKSFDSKIPNIFTTSGTFNDIILSWTLVPKAKLPKVNPSFKVSPPVPDDESTDLIISTFSDTFLIFVLEITLLFLKVAINLAFPLATLNPTNCAVALAFVNANLLESIAIVLPSVFIKTYLSSSKGKNTSLSSALTKLVFEFVIVTSNCLLITILELTRSANCTFLLGNTLYKLSLSDLLPDPKVLWISLPTNSKLDTSSCVWGTPPSTTPATLVTPITFKDVSKTPMTLLRVGSVLPGLLYLIKSPVVTIPANVSPALVTCETPDVLPTPAAAAAAPTVPPPKLKTFLGIKSPVNVATPTVPYNDPMSDIS